MNKKLAIFSIMIAFSAMPLEVMAQAPKCSEILTGLATKHSLEQLFTPIHNLASNLDAVSFTVARREQNTNNGMSIDHRIYRPDTRRSFTGSKIQIPRIRSLRFEWMSKISQSDWRRYNIEAKLHIGRLVVPLTFDRNWAPSNNPLPGRYYSARYHALIQLPNENKFLVQIQAVLDTTPEVFDFYQNREWVTLAVTNVTNELPAVLDRSTSGELPIQRVSNRDL